MRLNLRRMLPAVAMLLVAMVFGSSVADAAGPPMDAARAKLALEARGIGSAVKVRQGDGAMHRGTIVSLGEQSFVFQEKGRPPSEVPFSEVRSVQGPGMSRGAKVGLGLGIGAAAFVVLLVIGAASSAGVGGQLKVAMACLETGLPSRGPFYESRSATSSIDRVCFRVASGVFRGRLPCPDRLWGRHGPVCSASLCHNAARGLTSAAQPTPPLNR